MARKAQLDAVRPILEATDEGLNKVESVLDAVDKVADKGTNFIESGLEKVADVVPEVIDTGVRTSTDGARAFVRFFRNPRNVAVSVVIASGLAGAGLGVAGYFLAKKRLRAKLEKEMANEIESQVSEVRRLYALRHKEGNFATPEGAAEELLPPEAARAMRDYRGESERVVEVIVSEQQEEIPIDQEGTDEQRVAALRKLGYTDEQIAEVVGNNRVSVDALREKMKSGQPIEVEQTTRGDILVDGQSIGDFDYAAEVAKRDPSEPYVITHDEFMENENGWTQNTLTYYNGDDVLADDRDLPIPDIEAIVGSENLSKFGYGSRDKNVVYVRNEKLSADYEITLNTGEFSKEVAGFQHSASLRRFRRGDDE